MNPKIDAILDEIGGDKTEGATSLAMRGLDALELLVDVLPQESNSALLAIVELVRKIESLRPSMSAIGTQAVLALSRARGLMELGLSPPAALLEAVKIEKETSGQANVTIAELTLQEYGTGGIAATCSWSVTAMQTLVSLKPKLVRIGEGHRLGDGLRAAKWLAARGLDVEVMPDGAMPFLFSGARVVIVGADQVLSDGSVVNRCSTLSLALAAQYHEVPFSVACQRIKLSGNKSTEIETSKQLFNDLPQGVTAKAPLFDITPGKLIHSFFTESGRLSPREAGEVGVGIRSLRDELLS